MAKMEKMVEKKELDPTYKSAKMSTLKELRDAMVGMMKDDLQKPGMKKVSVASNDEEGLISGLDKAKDIVDSEDGEHMDDHGLSDMFGVSPEMEESAEEGDSMEPEHEGGLSPEEEQLLQLLLKKRK